MTVAQVKTAARILKYIRDEEIVSLNEIGSEGAVLRIGAFTPGKGRFLENTWLIARDGSAQSREGERVDSR